EGARARPERARVVEEDADLHGEQLLVRGEDDAEPVGAAALDHLEDLGGLAVRYAVGDQVLDLDRAVERHAHEELPVAPLRSGQEMVRCERASGCRQPMIENSFIWSSV